MFNHNWNPKRSILVFALVAIVSLLAAAGVGLAIESSAGTIITSDSSGQNGTTLSATKAATGFLTRTVTYDWTLQKSVSPTSITLTRNQSGTVSYTLTANRTVASDVTVAGSFGDISVTNGGGVTTENLTIIDQVQYKTGSGQFQDIPGASQTIVPPQLQPGETGLYPYSITFAPIPGALYRNTVKVTITNHSGSLGQPFGPEPKADFTVPAQPTIVEVDESATVSDAPAPLAGFTTALINTGQGTGPWGPFTGTFNQPAGPFVIKFNRQITNVSAPYATTFNLDNTATITENDTLRQRQASARVTIYTGPAPTPTPTPTPTTTPTAGTGCTPGYWKNHPKSWVGLSPNQTVTSAGFTVPALPDGSNGSTLSSSSLVQALAFQGGPTINGAAQILLRAAVAARLNLSNPSLNYPAPPGPTAILMANVNAKLNSGSRDAILTLATQIDTANNIGCPLK